MNAKSTIWKKISSITLATTALMATPHANAATCWDIAAKKHGLDAWMLFSIAAVESTFREGISSQNSNKSTDLGIMQINTIHLPYFKKLGYSRQDLQYNSCKNIMAAGYLLKDSIRRYGYNVNGIGGYHSNTPHLRIAYGKKVLKKYRELTAKYEKGGQHFSFEHYRTNGKKPIVKKSVNIAMVNRKPSLKSGRVTQVVQKNNNYKNVAYVNNTNTQNKIIKVIYVNPNNTQNSLQQVNYVNPNQQTYSLKTMSY